MVNIIIFANRTTTSRRFDNLIYEAIYIICHCEEGIISTFYEKRVIVHALKNQPNIVVICI